MAESVAYPHEPMVEIAPDVMFVHGRMRMGPGMVINRNMVIVRSGTELALLNPIRLTPEGEAALHEYGQVKHVVRLGPAHGVDDAYTCERFGAKFWSVGGETDYAEPKPDAVLEEGVELPIPDAELFAYRETARPELCVLVRRGGGLLVSCDSVQHWERTSNCSLPGKLIARLMGFLHPANIGPPWRKFMTKPDGSLKPDFERLLELEFDRLAGAHGQPLLSGAREALRATVERVYA